MGTQSGVPGGRGVRTSRQQTQTKAGSMKKFVNLQLFKLKL